MNVAVDAIPAELRELPQWVVWQVELRDGKPTKVPYIAVDPDRKASTTDAGTWATFDEALSGADWLDLAGVGFVLSAGDPYSGVDLDDCLAEEGLHPDAGAILAALDSYSEISPSGHGVKTIVRASLNGFPRNRTRKTGWAGEFEVYDHDRFFTITGDLLRGCPPAIEDRQAQLDTVLELVFGKTVMMPAAPSRPPQPVDVDDQELLERAFAAKNGARFAELWHGSTSAYNDDDSAADQALCNLLAFWTGRDPDRIDRLFRSSKLYREKWERADYRALTISKAIAATNDVYTPPTATSSLTSSRLRPEPAPPAIVEKSVDESPPAGLRLRGVIYERVRPVRWLWSRRIPCGLPSLLVGEEGVGKGTAVAWLIAQTTLGKLEGDLENEPRRVLIVGDEDAFEPIWVPRLYAANADLTMVQTLDDGEYLDDLAGRAGDLASAILDEQLGLVVFDQLLDHIYGGSEGQAIYNPKSVRESMLPLRRVASSTNVALLGLLHPIKGRVASFRQLIAGSHQFNAVSRSSLLLGVDPADERRRIIVRGKGNHSAVPRSFEFTIVAEAVDLNGHTFEVPRVVGEAEGDRTINDLLNPPDAAPVRDELVVELRAALGPEPQGTGVLAEAVGRDAKDGSVRNALAWMVAQGEAEKVGRGQWKTA